MQKRPRVTRASLLHTFAPLWLPSSVAWRANPSCLYAGGEITRVRLHEQHESARARADLKVLGLDPHTLQAVRMEHTKALPGFHLHPDE